MINEFIVPGLYLSVLRLFAPKANVASNSYLAGVMVETGLNASYLFATCGAMLAVCRIPGADGLPPLRFIVPEALLSNFKYRNDKEVLFQVGEPIPEHGSARLITLKTPAGTAISGNTYQEDPVDWRKPFRALPPPCEAPAMGPVHYDFRLLATIGKAYTLLHGPKCCRAAVYPQGTKCAGLVSLGHDDFLAVIMPFREDFISDDPPAFRDWLDRSGQAV